MKRFWQQARAVATADGWTIALDGRLMRLPGGATLHLDRAALAQAVAAEWQAAGDEPAGVVRSDDLPLTGLAASATQRIPADLAAQIAGLTQYGAADLLCHRAPPGGLADRQAAEWQPWLDWLAREDGAVLQAGIGIAPLAQTPAAMAALRDAVAAFDPYDLAGLGVIVPALSSLVLGLAVARGVLPAETACELAELEARSQQAVWGIDPEAAARQRRLADEVATAARFIVLSREP